MSNEVMRVTVVWSRAGIDNSRTGGETTVFEEAGFRPHGLVVFEKVPTDENFRVTLYPWWTIRRVRIGGE